MRHHVLRDVWTIVKRFGADSIVNIERREMPYLGYFPVVEGPIDDPHRLLLASLARGLGATTFFEIGTNRGYTTWTVAHNNPDLEVFTLDVPPGTDSKDVSLALGSDDERFLINPASCGEGFRSTPEETRITQLYGDSANFDFTPYAGRIDLVYVDGAHTYEYVMSDSRNALSMLTDTGTVAWDDYTSNPGVWRALRELAHGLDLPIYHVYGTRMAVYSRRPDFVRRLPPDSHVSLPAV